MARNKDRFTPFTEEDLENAADEYDPFNDYSYVTCYPGAESTYREPWFDPDMMPIHYAGEKPVYRFSGMRIVADGDGEEESDTGRVLVYHGEHTVAEFPTRSIVALSHLSGGYFVYADSNRCQFEFVFEESKEAHDICDIFMRLGII